MSEEIGIRFGPLRVSQVARLLGISEAMLRRGEKEGRIPMARRDVNGWRYYNAEDVAELERILRPEPKGTQG